MAFATAFERATGRFASSTRGTSATSPIGGFSGGLWGIEILCEDLHGGYGPGDLSHAAEAAQCLLTMRGTNEPALVLDVLAIEPGLRAQVAIIRICAACTEQGVAFARRCLAAGDLMLAALAMSELTPFERLDGELHEIATTIASVPPEGAAGWIAHVRALKILLDLPPIEREVWGWLKGVHDDPERLLASRVGGLVQDDTLEPLEVLEHWLRTARDPRHLGELCRGLDESITLQRYGAHRAPLSTGLQWRIVQNAAVAWRQGASSGSVARFVERALYGRTDIEYRAMGLDDLALAIAASDATSRRILM